MRNRGAGQLRDRVAFDRPSWGPDVSGGQSREWGESHRCLGEFIYTGGGEKPDAGKLAALSKYKLRIHQSAAAQEIQPGWRMRDLRRGPQDGDFPGIKYNIREVDAITDRRWIYLVVESGAPS
jgi:head-tail adaptor